MKGKLCTGFRALAYIQTFKNMYTLIHKMLVINDQGTNLM